MLVEAASEIASRITGAIRNAAAATGASFDYLLKTALRESNLDPDAKAATSSAAGLFQFIDQTWLGTMKRAGAELGYGDYAKSIVRTPSGRYVVPDPAQRQQIMRLRADPNAAAAMAGAFTTRNAAVLAERLGRPASDGELYIAHVLGPAGAVKLIASSATAPGARAADLFPHAARANRGIFYDRAGAPRSLAQVYGVLVNRHDQGRALPLVARATPAPDRAIAPRVAPAQAAAFAAEAGPVFHGLFRTEARAPVSRVVSELWGPKEVALPRAVGTRVAEVAPAASAARPGATAAHPLDLRQFRRPHLRAASGPSG